MIDPSPASPSVDTSTTSPSVGVPPSPFSPALSETLTLFRYAHLSIELQAVSKPFCELAHSLVYAIPENRQLHLALDALLMSKDAAVRAFVLGLKNYGPSEVGPR